MTDIADRATAERAKQIAAGTDRKIPYLCDAWHCRQRPTVLTETFDFLCDEHAKLKQE